MNFMPFGQLKSFLKILIEVQYKYLGSGTEPLPFLRRMIFAGRRTLTL